MVLLTQFKFFKHGKLTIIIARILLLIGGFNSSGTGDLFCLERLELYIIRPCIGRYIYQLLCKLEASVVVYAGFCYDDHFFQDRILLSGFPA